MKVVSRIQLECLITIPDIAVTYTVRYDVTLASGGERLKDGGQPGLLNTPQHDYLVFCLRRNYTKMAQSRWQDAN